MIRITVDEVFIEITCHIYVTMYDYGGHEKSLG